MGIIIDLILFLVIALSAFLGYKKGLVELGIKLFAGIIAIICTLVLFRPVSSFIINNTQVDEKLTSIIIEKVTDAIEQDEEDEGVQNSVINQFKEDTILEQSETLSHSIIQISTIIILFIIIKIALRIILGIANLVTELPLLKQFNEVGGMIYGIVRGVVIVLACILVMGVIAKVNPSTNISKQLESTYVTKTIYNMIIKF